MSFGLSSGGGQVRYAVIFDSTQAENNVRRYQTSLQQLATGTTGVSGKMAIMNNTFTAGVTPIKNQGNALNQLSTTQKTIGSQLGSLGSAFKSNALAIGAAASSVLGLYQNYANLSSAQNAANKSATAAKAAQNSVATATKNLGKAIDQYGKGSKEAKAAQDKLTVAQERAVNKTESAKIAQDNLNQTMADFGINILPNIILAGGSIVSIFDNIGKSGSGVTGIISKLGSALGGLGGGTGGLKGMFTSITNGLSGIAVGGPAAGAGMKAFGAGVDTASLSLKGIIGTLGQAAALITGFFVGGAIKQGVKELVTTQQEFHNATISTLRTLGLTEPQLKSLSEILSSINEKLGQGTLKFNGVATAIQKSVGPSQELVKAQDAVNKAMADPALRSHVTVTANAAKVTLDHAKAELARQQSMEATRNTTVKLGGQIKILADNTNTAQNAGGGLMAIISGLGSEDAKLQKQTIDLNIALQSQFEIMQNAAPKDLFEALAKGGPIIQTLGDETKAADPKMKALIGTLNTGGPVMDDFLGSAQPLGPALVADAESAAQLKKSMVDVAAATTAGNDKFAAFLKTTGEAAIADKIHAAGLRSIVAAHVELDPSINLTTSDLEGMTKSIIEGKSAAIAYGDIVAKQMAPAIATFQGLLDTKNIKDFNKAFKELDLGKLDKGLGKGLKEAFKPLRAISEKSGELVHLFDAMAVVGGKLSQKNIGKTIKEMSDGFKDMGKTQPLIKKFGDTVLSFVKTAPNMADAWKQVNPAIQKYNELTKDGSFSLTDYNDVMAVFNETTGKAPPKLDAAQAALAKFGGEASSFVTIAAQMSASMVTSVGTAVDFITNTLGSIASIQVSPPNESKYQKGLQLAIDNAAQTVKFIKSQLLKISGIQVPPPNETKYQKGLQLAINNAAQTKKFIEKELNKIGGIKVPAPKFNNFNSALDQAVSDAKRAVRDINNALTKIKKPSSGGGGGNGSGPGATTGPFNNNASKSDIFVGGSKSDSGGSGGDTIINVHVMDETIMRRITARSGRGRFTMGA